MVDLECARCVSRDTCRQATSYRLVRPLADGGSRPRRSPQGRLRRLTSCRAADARLSAPARFEPPDQGARPNGAGPVPGMRSAGTGRRFDQAGASERMTLASRDNQNAPRAGLGELGYGSTTPAKEVAPQIAAQSPSDRSAIKIKDAPVSGQLSAVRFSNASAGSPQAPRDRILLSTRFPPSGVQKFYQHNIYLIALHCKSQGQAFGALLNLTISDGQRGAPRGKRLCRVQAGGLPLHLALIWARNTATASILRGSRAAKLLMPAVLLNVLALVHACACVGVAAW